MKTDDTVQRRSDLVAAEMDGGLVMMDVASGKYFHLTGAGSAIWDKIDSPVRVSDLIDMLTKEYAVSREVCEKETLEFLSDLKERGLLTVDP